MVNDKWQVRTTGKVDAVTRQPVKGRKRGGGIRFGEMERDALLAHGTSFLLQDRLMNCSDYSTGWVCRTCGSLISLGYDSVASAARVGRDNVDPLASLGPSGEYCRICRADDDEALKLEGVGVEAETGPPSVRFSLADNAERIGRRGQMDVIAIPHVFKVRAGDAVNDIDARSTSRPSSRPCRSACPSLSPRVVVDRCTLVVALYTTLDNDEAERASNAAMYSKRHEIRPGPSSWAVPRSLRGSASCSPRSGTHRGR